MLQIGYYMLIFIECCKLDVKCWYLLNAANQMLFAATCRVLNAASQVLHVDILLNTASGC